jgi:lysozyme
MKKRIFAAIGLLAALALIVFVLCFFGVWIPNKPSQAKYPIRGIDVSHHQGAINWKSLKTSGVHFAYMKATEGADFTDPKFAENWKNSREAGVVRGAYHFFTFGTPGQAQAANFISQVPAELDALPPTIDLEFSGYNKERRVAPDEFQRELAAFWDAIFSHYRKSPVVYTTYDFQKQYLAAMPIERLWIREVVMRPSQPWTFWQFSPRGRVPGISTFVDLNVFQGTASEFSKLNQPREE